LLCSAKCFARSAQNTRPRPRVVVVVWDSAGLIRVSFLPSFLPCLATIIYFLLKKHFRGSFLGNNKKSAFLFCAKFQFLNFFRCKFKFRKTKSPKFEKKEKKNPYKFPQISIHEYEAENMEGCFNFSFHILK
jgi:hypothetical protein